MFEVDVATTVEDVARLLPEWQRLDAALTPRLPFTSPAWCLTWWRHFRRSGLAARDELRVYTLRDAGGRLVGLAPMFVALRPGVGPIATRELQFFGADPYVTELRGPVCRREDLAAVSAALVAHVALEDGYDWVQWRGLSPEAQFAGDPAVFLPDGKLDSIDHFLRLDASWETYKSTLPRNIKESLRKCYNSLARDGIRFTFRVIETGPAVREAIDVFFRLHAGRAGLAGTIDHADAFASASAKAFLSDYAEAMALGGSLRIFQLVIDETIVATRIGFLLGDELYLYFSGYDAAWSRYSVMTTTVAESLKWAIGQGLGIVNLSSGTDVSKTRWRPHSVTAVGGYTCAPAALSRLAFNLVRRLRAGRTADPDRTEDAA